MWSFSKLGTGEPWILNILDNCEKYGSLLSTHPKLLQKTETFMCNSDTSVWQNFLYAWNLINLIPSFWLPISCTKNQWNSDTCWKCLSYYSTSWTLPSQVVLSFLSFGLVNEAIERRAEQTSKWHAHWTQRLLLPVVPTFICWALQSVKHTQLIYAWSYMNSAIDCFHCSCMAASRKKILSINRFNPHSTLPSEIVA